MAILKPFTHTLWALALTLTAAATQQPTHHIVVPSTPPGTTGPEVNPNFPAFAFETAAFVRYAQYDDGTPNAFSQNLINSVMSRTGGRPVIRLGGTSGDFAPYVPTQSVPALPVDENDGYQDVGGTSIGPSYFPLSHNFPDALYILQVPLALANVSEAVAWTRAGISGIGLDRIVSIEIGNEPDLYNGKPRVQPKLDTRGYVDAFLKHEDAILGNLTDLPDAPLFQAIDASSWQESVYPVRDVFRAGINKNGRVKSIGQHFYQTTATPASTLAETLMNHSAITTRLNGYKPGLSYLTEKHPDIPLILSEIGNSLNAKHLYDFQGVLGSALWQVDMQLYCMVLGIAAAHFQQIMHSGFDLWLPVDSAGLEAQVFPPFYAQPFVADFIGKSGGGEGGGNGARIRVATLETGMRNVPGYVAYAGGEVVRTAFVNLNVWDRGDGIRPVRRVELEVPDTVKEVEVLYLTSGDGAHARGGDGGGNSTGAEITYAGSQWTRRSEGREVKGVGMGSRKLKVEGGKVVVRVPDSCAALVHVG